MWRISRGWVGASTCVFLEDMVCEVLYNSVMKELLDTIERKNQWMDWSFGVCGCVSVCQTICQCVGVSMYVRVFC